MTRPTIDLTTDAGRERLGALRAGRGVTTSDESVRAFARLRLRLDRPGGFAVVDPRDPAQVVRAMARRQAAVLSPASR